ncbi:MAG: hypothetical protein LKG12_04365 [Bifidobacterium tibiigranuli]|jgi:hypothetical protein|nr:hypothetical protein [Bifidobacterium tibiigranuli]
MASTESQETRPFIVFHHFSVEQPGNKLAQIIKTLYARIQETAHGIREETVSDRLLAASDDAAYGLFK